MARKLICAVALLFVLGTGASTGWSDILVDFEGTYNFGLYDWWKWETDGWGEPAPDTVEMTPGLGGSGSCQGVRTYDGSHYILKTMEVTTPGLTYQVSVWLRTYYFNGDPADPGVLAAGSWVELGWDPQARDTTQPNSNLIWNVDPKDDFANNTGNWVQYFGEPFVAPGSSVTVAFKVGNIATFNSQGIMAQFDNLAVVEVEPGGEVYTFPDTFDTTYTMGVAQGWAKRFIPGGTTPRWAEYTPGHGGAGSAQRIYAGTEATGLGVNIGLVKRFAIEPGPSYTMTLWVNAADSSGTVLTDPNPDPGPVVKFGIDTTAQTNDPDSALLRWNEEPTEVFSTPGKENTWQQFRLPYVRPTTDTVSVWLWVEGDHDIGVDAKFDDLAVERSLDLEVWHLYR